MKRIKVLGSVLKRTRADKIIIGFIAFIFAIAAVIQLVEPDINRYGDALWYCYAVISTAGSATSVRESCAGDPVRLVFQLADFTRVVMSWASPVSIFWYKICAMFHRLTGSVSARGRWCTSGFRYPCFWRQWSPCSSGTAPGNGCRPRSISGRWPRGSPP